jgi:glycosyltransferase involved in cell wall biosynthesis
VSTTVVVVSNDTIGTRMAGPGIRYWQFANELSRQHSVTLVTPNQSDLISDSFRIEHAATDDATAIIDLAGSAGAVVAQRLPVRAMLALAERGVKTIYDLYAPVFVETLAIDQIRAATRHRDTVLRSNALIEEVALRTGTAFVCASERQRDYWLGALAAFGRLTHRVYGLDPSLRNLIDVVPFGVDPAPSHIGGAIKGRIEGIEPDDHLVIWPGGIWNWFDPLTVIRAMGRLERTHPNLRLFFLGVQHPNPDIEPMEMASRAVTVSRELGLLGRTVFFNDHWVPYADRIRYLRDADVGVSAHFATLEARLAFRTRLLDCLWAGLPIVATEGDELADAAATAGAGVAVAPNDVAAFANALSAVLSGPSDAMRAASETLAERYRWPTVIGPLSRLIEAPVSSPMPPPSIRLKARDVAARARWSFEVRGAGAVMHAARRAMGRRQRSLP